ncbi:hypothetical protein [Acidithiobacillus thiooxidans]|uniref:hypothetical protein n=1 Tax=Acidithiobacillus thiooxidans TaxID=930 RepID=UPI00356536C5|nr:hypothetical protein [Acidithiobacillus sp.]
MDIYTESNKAVIHIGYTEIKNWLNVVIRHEEYQAGVTVATATGEILSKMRYLIGLG